MSRGILDNSALEVEFFTPYKRRDRDSLVLTYTPDCYFFAETLN
jgi:hypothetical protein